MRPNPTHPQVFSYCGDFDGVLDVWARMGAAGHAPTPKLWGSLLLACSAAGQLEQAAIFWWEMRQVHAQGAGGVLTTDNVCGMMTACNDAGQYERALIAFEDARGLGVPLDTRAYNIALRACHTPGKTLRQEQLMQVGWGGEGSVRGCCTRTTCMCVWHGRLLAGACWAAGQASAQLFTRLLHLPPDLSHPVPAPRRLPSTTTSSAPTWPQTPSPLARCLRCVPLRARATSRCRHAGRGAAGSLCSPAVPPLGPASPLPSPLFKPATSQLPPLPPPHLAAVCGDA